MRKVLVVSDSPALRETVDIVLGDQFVVEVRAASEAPSRLDTSVAVLVVDDAAPVPLGEAPILVIGERRPGGAAPGSRRRHLPKDFDALALRQAVEELLQAVPSGPSGPFASFLAPPLLPAALSEVAARAVRSALPLCVWGEAGTGKLRLARAVHRQRGAAYFQTVSAPEVNASDLRLPPQVEPSGEVTLVVTNLEDLDAAGQRRAVEVLESGSLPRAHGDPVSTRVIATSRRDPAVLVREGRLGRPLFYHLGVLTLPLPPLRERTGDLPEIIRAVAAGLCTGLGLPPVSFTEASLRRLSRYLWFGNLAELEAVLARSIVFAAEPVLDTKDLRFGYGGTLVASGAARTPEAEKPAQASRWAANGDAVDLIIHELAHEFKNPMVTIKTFAHQLDHLLERNGGQEEFARLTGEAVERMDAALENLVQYTRFDAPSRQPTSLGSLVSAAIGSVEEYVSEKQLALEVEPTAAQVLVDPAQCGYAIKNLLRAVARDLSHGDSLALRAPGPATLAIEYPARARSAANSLSRLVSGDAESQDALPLGFAFAKSLIERNGGHLEVDRNGDIARVMVEFPLAGDRKGENGQAQGSGGR